MINGAILSFSSLGGAFLLLEKFEWNIYEVLEKLHWMSLSFWKSHEKQWSYNGKKIHEIVPEISFPKFSQPFQKLQNSDIIHFNQNFILYYATNADFQNFKRKSQNFNFSLTLLFLQNSPLIKSDHTQHLLKSRAWKSNTSPYSIPSLTPTSPRALNHPFHPSPPPLHPFTRQSVNSIFALS